MKSGHIILFACLLLSVSSCNSTADSDIKPLALSGQQAVLQDDFGTRHGSWQEMSGKWLFTDGVVRQTSTSDDFPLILRTDRQFADLDVSVDFKALSGRIDASGGIVFRAQDKDNYYIVRANSLEDNFRLYTFKNGRRSQIASARVEPPALAAFHTIRVVAVGDHIQAYLNGVLLLDHHDSSWSQGYIGLWTKADAVTDFDDFRVIGSAR